MKIHGTLECWQRMADGSYIAFIYGDIKGRFPDGHRIRTSKSAPMSGLTEGDMVMTRNSNYLLGTPAEEWGDPDEE